MPALRALSVGLAALSLCAGVLLLAREGGRHAALTLFSRASASEAAQAPPDLPLPKATDSAIAIGNLEVQIRDAEAQLAREPRDPTVRPILVGYLLTHGEFVGSIADYERAEEIAEDAVRRSPNDAKAYQTRARARSVFHRFGEASADLVQAEALGASPRELSSARASILAARGRLDDAVTMLEHAPEPPSPAVQLSLALLYLEVGREAEGTEMVERARRAVRDVTPFPLAWLDYQEAAIRERHGDETRARQLYMRAHRLVPTYAAAASHLAPYLGPRESANMLEQVAKRSDDPEVLVFLAASLRKLGRIDEADRDLETAAARYDDLTRRHEAAFADHGARFWLGAGHDPERAYVFAQKNLTVRQTSAAFDLALTAALMTKRDEASCDIATRGLESSHLDDSFRAVARSTLATRCGQVASSP